MGVGGLPVRAKPAHLEQPSCSSQLSDLVCFFSFPVDIYAHFRMCFLNLLQS